MKIKLNKFDYIDKQFMVKYKPRERRCSICKWVIKSTSLLLKVYEYGVEV